MYIMLLKHSVAAGLFILRLVKYRDLLFFCHSDVAKSFPIDVLAILLQPDMPFPRSKRDVIGQYLTMDLSLTLDLINQCP